MNVEAMLNALGTKENITQIDACMTRLRVSLKDVTRINKQQLTELGALDVVEVPNGVQVILGKKAQQYKDEISPLL